MDRRAKVELFEQIRHEYEFGVGTIKGVATKLGVHRRLVRQALASAIPPERKRPVRPRPVLGPVTEFIERILEQDLTAPRKQRHTAHRIWVRITEEVPSPAPSESTVRKYVRSRKRALALAGREVFVPQSYQPGEQAQVDWYEAVAEIDGVERKAQIFAMRSMYSGAAFHHSYPSATQQAFFDAHSEAFSYFGGVFATLRYDNLSSAVRKILRGHHREYTTRFISFRSHYGFDASFCTPGQGHEKGGVEGEVGYFRRNHLVPIPRVAGFDELNRLLLDACLADHQRLIGSRDRRSGELFADERAHLRREPAEAFEIAEHCFPYVDAHGCVRVRTNFYSTPLHPGTRPDVRVYPLSIEVWHEGKRVAAHERCYGQYQQVLDLEHYLDVLTRKPGALPGATALEQWRAQGRWPVVYDRLWKRLEQRLGRQDGARAMVGLLQEGRRSGYDVLAAAIEQALAYGCTDPSAVTYLMRTAQMPRSSVESLDVGELDRYERPKPSVVDYDEFLKTRRKN